MKTREQMVSENEYDVDEYGTIQSPGKFEGEPWWAVVFYARRGDGDGEYLDDGADLFTVDAEDREAYGFDDDVVSVILTESERGFVSVETLTAEEEEGIRAQAEENRGPCDDDYVITDARGVGVRVSAYVAELAGARFADEDAALAAIRRTMDAEGYWPNVWRQNERGDCRLIRSVA